MQAKTFKAVNIYATDGDGRASLIEAFNTWAERERPSTIVHVYYYHDMSSHVRGYQIIYEQTMRGTDHWEPAKAA